MVLEGGRSLREGYVAGLPPKRVVELLGRPGADGRSSTTRRLMVDRAMTGAELLRRSMLGVVINEVPRADLEHA